MLEHLFRESGARAIIFDMDGTLVNNMDYHRVTWIEWARREGLGLTEDELLAQTHGTAGEIVRRLFPQVTSPQEIFEIGERKEALYREIYAPHLMLLTGLKPLLHEAQLAGVALAVATAGDRTNVAFTLDGLHIRSFFQTIVSGEDVTHGKPHPEVFLIAAENLGIASEFCLVFEDSVAGAEAARRAGMKCIVVNPMTPRDTFGESPHILHFATDYNDLEFQAG